MATLHTGVAPPDVSDEVSTIERDGIVGRKGVFPREWVEQLRSDMETAFAEARGRKRGAVSRGPQRWYVEVHPSRSAAGVNSGPVPAI